MTACWTRNQCIWHYTEWRHVGLVISASDIIQNDGMLDSWSVYLTLYRMTACWTRNLCIWHYTEWRHVGLVICDIILTLYRMTEWRNVGHVGLVICVSDHYTEWRHVGLVICVSDIIQNDGMLDWSSVYLTLYRMDPRWTRDLCIWHYTEWRHVGLVICVSDIIQNDGMLDSWTVYLTLYRMTACRTRNLCIWYYTEWCWTCDLCIWYYTEWRNVGLVICVSDIIQNNTMLDS